jgi:hypothetical protein
MTKNRLTDLNNHLFAQVERLGDETLKGDALREEIERAWAISKVSQHIINNAGLLLRARVAGERDMLGVAPLPAILAEGD